MKEIKLSELIKHVKSNLPERITAHETLSLTFKVIYCERVKNPPSNDPYDSLHKEYKYYFVSPKEIQKQIGAPAGSCSCVLNFAGQVVLKVFVHSLGRHENFCLHKDDYFAVWVKGDSYI